MRFFDNSNKSLEDAQTAWCENIHAVVRLAFRDVIYKENGYYCIAMKDQILKLKDCPTLVDVYLYIYHQNEDFKKKINDLYDENWSTTLIIDMVKNPGSYREKMEKVNTQVRQELSLFSKRPSVGKDDFAICPRRSGIVAVVTIEKDLETVRDAGGK